jgi:IS4 transposase
MRLIVKRLSAAEAERCRQRAQRKSRKQGKALQPQTLQAAGYVLILTSLDVAQFSAEDILAIYRLRWQIELLFKRLKSLLHLDELPAKDPDLVRCWIYAKLIAALLLEEVAGPFLDFPPSSAHAAAAFPVAPPALAA